MSNLDIDSPDYNDTNVGEGMIPTPEERKAAMVKVRKISFQPLPEIVETDGLGNAVSPHRTCDHYWSGPSNQGTRHCLHCGQVGHALTAPLNVELVATPKGPQEGWCGDESQRPEGGFPTGPQADWEAMDLLEDLCPLAWSRQAYSGISSFGKVFARKPFCCLWISPHPTKPEEQSLSFTFETWKECFYELRAELAKPEGAK